MNILSTTTGFDVPYINCSNTVLYKGLTDKKIASPKIPTYIDNNGVAQENPFSSRYAEAVTVYHKSIELAILEIVLETCVIFSPEWKLTPRWHECVEMMYRQSVLPRNNLELSFIKYFVFNNLGDQSKLAHEVFLTETRVYDIFGTVHIQREGVDIHKAYLKNTVDTQIEVQPVFVGLHQLVNPLDEYMSCTESNMSWDKWYSNEYTLDQKASAVALHRLSKVRDIHTNDSMQIHAERESKRNNK